MAIVTASGVTLPDIPEGLLDTYHYFAVVGVNGAGYMLICSDTMGVAFKLSSLGMTYDLITVLSGNVYVSEMVAGETAWPAGNSMTVVSGSEPQLPIGTAGGDTYTAEWTNYNIPVGELDSSGNPTGNLTGEVYFYSMVSLEIPQWVLNSYPYAAKFKTIADYSDDMNSFGYADENIEGVIASTSPMLFNDSKITCAEPGYILAKSNGMKYVFGYGSLGRLDFSVYSDTSDYFTLSQEITWSNHNIMVAEADTEGNLTATDEVYFSGEGLVLPPEEYGVATSDVRRIAYNVRRLTGEHSGYTVDKLGPSLDDLPEMAAVTNSGASKWIVFDPAGMYFPDLMYANGLWVGRTNEDNGTIISGGLYYSTDLKTWTPSNVTTGASGLLGYINNTWFACKYTLSSEGRKLLSSKDGRTWVEESCPYAINELIYVDGYWILTSVGGIYYSVDNRQTWTLACDGAWNGFGPIAYANGIWVSGARLNNSGTETYGLWYSEDNGKTCTMVDGTKIEVFSVIIYENGLWLAGAKGSGYIYYSEDGKTWTKGTGTTGSITHIVYANGIYAATSDGTSGKVFYSEDGKTWTQALAYAAYELEFAHGIWVVATANGLYSSTDGKLWTKSDYSGVCRWLKNVNGLWLAHEYHYGDTTNYLFSPSFILPV